MMFKKSVTVFFLGIFSFCWAGGSSNLARLLESEPGRIALQRVGAVKLGDATLAQLVLGKELGDAFLKQGGSDSAQKFLDHLTSSSDPTIKDFLAQHVATLDGSLAGKAAAHSEAVVLQWASSVEVSLKAQSQAAAAHPSSTSRLHRLASTGSHASGSIDAALTSARKALLAKSQEDGADLTAEVVSRAFAVHARLSKNGAELLGTGITSCALDQGWPSSNIATALHMTAAAGAVADSALVVKNIASALALRIGVSFAEAKDRVCELATRCHFYGPLVVRGCVAGI